MTMTQPISRTELYQRVDDAFYQRFPQAPRPLAGADQAEWEQWWRAERDRQLEEEINRVYWARWPDAPIELDDTSPEWEKWRIIQRKIREEVLSNAPEPEDVEYQNAVDVAGELDLSYLKAVIRQSFAEHDNIQPDLIDDLVKAGDQIAAELGAQAMASGDMHGEWKSREVEVHGRGEHRVAFEVTAWWYNHYFTGVVSYFGVRSEDAEPLAS
jgi:hypothetical protein